MSKGNDKRVARKAFLGATALAASAAALAGCKDRASLRRNQKLGRIVYPVLTPDLYDYAGMMAKIRTSNPHRQLFPGTAASVQPSTNTATLYLHMQFAMNSYQFSIPSGAKLATLGVLSGTAVVFSLNDEMWRKYAFGERFDLAETNIYYHAISNLDPHASPDDPKGLYQDWSAQAVLKRGGSFMVCHHALTYFAADCAMRRDRDPKLILDEWLKNLLPGFMIVPSGILAVQLAAENGWKIYPSG
jgi:uncharacterized protein YaiE (UPF0345 family)